MGHLRKHCNQECLQDSFRHVSAQSLKDPWCGLCYICDHINWNTYKRVLWKIHFSKPQQSGRTITRTHIHTCSPWFYVVLFQNRSIDAAAWSTSHSFPVVKKQNQWARALCQTKAQLNFQMCCVLFPSGVCFWIIKPSIHLATIWSPTLCLDSVIEKKQETLILSTFHNLLT